MKHNLRINLILVGIFLLAQFAGLYVVNHYIDHKSTAETQVVQWEPLPYNLERPEVKNQSTSFIWIMAVILIGTVLFLLLIRLNKPIIWKLWFFATVWIALAFSFNVVLGPYMAGILALALAAVRIFKPNAVVHNVSEIFIYGGLAAIFVPILNIFSAFMLLILISVYDMIAVWKTKHMVSIAKFQAKSRLFAGLFISYKRDSGESVKGMEQMPKETKKESQPFAAVLGGGDIGFPLIFAGVVMKSLMLQETVISGFLKTAIIPISASAALFFLLMKGSSNKFYPAMPFISLGCFVGYFMTYLI